MTQRMKQGKQTENRSGMAIGKTSADSGKNTPINRQIGGTVPRRKIPAQTDNKNTGRDGTRQIK